MTKQYQITDSVLEILAGVPIKVENVSDGYHTFKELYHYRMLFNALLFNEWAVHGKYNVQRSFKHSDGEPCFGGGWFIVVADTPFGQISNHYEAKDWDMFAAVPQVDIPMEYDGHTPQEAAERMSRLLKSYKEIY